VDPFSTTSQLNGDFECDYFGHETWYPYTRPATKHPTQPLPYPYTFGIRHCCCFKWLKYL